MKVIKAVIFSMFIYSVPLSAQNDITALIERVNSMYYLLSQTEIQNFSAWITSDVFKDRTDQLLDEEIYPLEMIWHTPDKLYFIQRPIQVADDSVYQILDRHQKGLQKELKAIMMDWQRFCAIPLLSDLPPDFIHSENGDTIVISLLRMEDSDSLLIDVFLGKNGVCLKIRSDYRGLNQIIYTYPSYYFSGNKWICAGWLVQIQEDRQITNAYAVDVINKTINNVLIPEKLIMQLQTKQSAGQTYRREYILRNVRLDRDLKILR